MRSVPFRFKDNMSNKKRIEKLNQKYPKGFDIELSELLSEFQIGEEEIKLLGTKGNGIAYAYIDKKAYYRRSQIEKLFKRSVTVVKEETLDV